MRGAPFGPLDTELGPNQACVRYKHNVLVPCDRVLYNVTVCAVLTQRVTG
jgi:hypothetical protein